jgi:dienelactone hydrolase
MVSAREVEYYADGAVMIGRLAVPDSDGPWPGVLIAHEGNGLDEHQKGRADRLAALGYAAFAMDYHGGGKVFTDREAMMARIGYLGSDPERLRGVAQAGLDTLLLEPGVDPGRVAAIGYCFGGTAVLELARSGADVKAVVGFHPGLTSPRPGDAANIVGRVLVCVGADDPVVPPDQRHAFEDEMRAAGIDWQVHVYGGVKHSFTHPNAAQAGMAGLEYNAAADRRSWQAMLGLFVETLH